MSQISWKTHLKFTLLVLFGLLMYKMSESLIYGQLHATTIFCGRQKIWIWLLVWFDGEQVLADAAGAAGEREFLRKRVICLKAWWLKGGWKSWVMKCCFFPSTCQSISIVVKLLMQMALKVDQWSLESLLQSWAQRGEELNSVRLHWQIQLEKCCQSMRETDPSTSARVG